MSTFKLTLQYDGTGFVGWQRQASGVSIQGLLEDAMGRLDGRGVTVTGAGRTDAGVHALGQVASLVLERTIEPDALVRALNGILPTTVRVVRAEAVDSDFNARFAARGKTYRYRVLTGVIASPFELRYAWHLARRLDDSRMADAARMLIGHHDFAAFRSTGSDVQTTTRTLHDISFRRVPVSSGAESLDESARILHVEVAGDGFLRHMVRTIVGTLIEVGTGQRDPASVLAALESGRRADAGVTAPGHGLFLVRVHY